MNFPYLPKTLESGGYLQDLAYMDISPSQVF